MNDGSRIALLLTEILKLRGSGKKIHNGRYAVCAGEEGVKHILLRYINSC